MEEATGADNDPATRARTSTAMIDSSDEEGEGNEDGLDDNEVQPSEPIRLRPFAKSDYLLREAPMSVEQEDWAKGRMRTAHDYFIEHMASRPGYGEIMLMLDPEDGAATSQYQPTGGEAAAAKDENKKIWAWLKGLPTAGDLSTQIEAGLASAIVQTISVKRGEYMDLYKRVMEQSNDERERQDATDWNEGYKDAKRWREGMQMALRLMWGVAAFNQNSNGPWVALLAWWLRLRAKAHVEDTFGGQGELITNVVQGKELCGKYSNKMSSKGWRENSQYGLWRGLWAFMERLVFWLKRNNGVTVVDQANALSVDPEFIEATSWENLGIRLRDRRP